MQLRGANSPEAMGCALEKRGHSLCTGTNAQPVKSLFVMQRKEEKMPTSPYMRLPPAYLSKLPQRHRHVDKREMLRVLPSSVDF